MKGPLLLLSNVVASPEGRLDDVLRGRILATLRKHAGAGLDIIIREHVRQRSLDQNAYLHAEPFPKLARVWFESVERAKLICMGEFWGWEPCKVTGQVLPVKAHTSSMTVEECTAFIEWLIPWANTEHHADVMLPNEWETAA